MHSISLDELIMAVRRQSQGFSRGSSAYRGVTHHPSGEAGKRGNPLARLVLQPALRQDSLSLLLLSQAMLSQL